MPNCLERVVDAASLLLGTVKRVADRVIVCRSAKLTFELQQVCARADPRKRDRFAIFLSQFVSSAKIIFARVIFGETEPGVWQPIRMLFGRSRKFRGVAAIRPIVEERKLFSFAE